MAYTDFPPDWALDDTVFIDGTNNKERPQPERPVKPADEQKKKSK